MTTRETERPVPATATPNPPVAAVKTTPPAANTGAPPPVRPKQLTIPPPGVEELEEQYAHRPDGAFAPEQAIDEQIADLEAWASSNLRSERRETSRFWFLRGLAFVGSVGAATGGAIQLPQLAIACGAVAAIAVAIDAAWPSTADRSARRRAIHDLRELQHTLKLKWDKVRLAYPNPQTPKRIVHALALLDATQSKREEISKYLGDATPGVTHKLAK
jgi:hypothetical protein